MTHSNAPAQEADFSGEPVIDETIKEWSSQVQLWFHQPETEEEFNLHREDHGFGKFIFEE